MKGLTIEAKTDNLDSVLNFINEELEAVDYPIKLQMQVSIAVEEIFINIACYAYSPEVGNVAICIAVKDEIFVEFMDKGKSYNPLETDNPDINLDIDERPIGGLGVFMAKQMMDTVEYRREDDKNILTMKKALA